MTASLPKPLEVDWLQEKGFHVKSEYFSNGLSETPTARILRSYTSTALSFVPKGLCVVHI